MQDGEHLPHLKALLEGDAYLKKLLVKTPLRVYQKGGVYHGDLFCTRERSPHWVKVTLEEYLDAAVCDNCASFTLVANRDIQSLIFLEEFATDSGDFRTILQGPIQEAVGMRLLKERDDILKHVLKLDDSSEAERYLARKLHLQLSESIRSLNSKRDEFRAEAAEFCGGGELAYGFIQTPTSTFLSYDHEGILELFGQEQKTDGALVYAPTGVLRHGGCGESDIFVSAPAPQEILETALTLRLEGGKYSQLEEAFKAASAL